ncbi:MFS transporter [Hansschlegelia sp. KR7-227]|uniref:MFS transporter n=1 Tax=Hansschlegelia sp. KR7-227 TaxID=3400914 RepID=UPI003BFBFC28
MPSTSRTAFAAAITTMLAMGIIYLWGIFAVPLEAELGVAGPKLSLVPSTALVCFTIGALIYDRLLRSVPLGAYVLLTFGLAGGGHLLFGLAPSFATLFVGYGVLFPIGAGLGYGLSLALASRAPDARRSVFISLTVSAFALSGVILAGLLPLAFAGRSASVSFAMIGAGLLAVGGAVLALTANTPSFATKAGPGRATDRGPWLSPLFFKLALAFFVFNYAGLMMVAHAVKLLASTGASTGLAATAPIALNLSYVAGSLLGGRLAEATPARRILPAIHAICAAGLLALLTASGAGASLAGVAAIGLVFGAAASVLPVLVGRYWGPDRISQVYGAMMFAYGLAGLLAPWVAAVLFDGSGDYTLALLSALAACAVGGAVSLTIAPVGARRQVSRRAATT